MAGTIPKGLKTAADYQAAFNVINRSVWSGSYAVLPVQLSDGRQLYLTGLSWTGALSTIGARTTASPKIMNALLIQQGMAIVPFSPSYYDAAGNGYLLDSRALPGEALNPIKRLEPVAATSLNQSLYLTARLTTDLTSQRPTGNVYLLEIPIGTLGSGKAPIRQAVALPSMPVSGEIGHSLRVWDNFLYLGTRTGTSPYAHGLARVPLQYLRTFPQLPLNLRYLSLTAGGAYSWMEDASATPILNNAGPNADIWYSANRNYNYLYRSGSSLAINSLAQRTLYRSASQINAQSITTATTAVADSGATGFSVQRVWDVPWAQLSSGNRLGMYGISHTAGTAFDVANPLTARPRFFEYASPSIGQL